RAASQPSRLNVLDVNADAVPAQGVCRVDRGDGQVGEAPDRQVADGEPGLSAWGAAEQQLRDAAAIVHCRRQRRKRDELAGALRNLGRVGEVGLAADDGACVDQGYEE